MSAELDKNPIPRYAVSMWCDENRVYLAIPLKGKAAFIDAYPLTAAGLGEALAKMRNYHTKAAAPPLYTPPWGNRREVDSPTRPTAKLAKPSSMSSDARLALAQDILKRLIITPRRS